MRELHCPEAQRWPSTSQLSAAVTAALLGYGALAQTQPPAGSAEPAPTTQRSGAAQGEVAIIKVDVERVALGQRASKLVGAAVVNSKDERIGTIDDLVVNPDDRVTYAVLSVGGSLGIGSKLVAVPFHSLQTVKEDRLMLPGATKEALDRVQIRQGLSGRPPCFTKHRREAGREAGNRLIFRRNPVLLHCFTRVCNSPPLFPVPPKNKARRGHEGPRRAQFSRPKIDKQIVASVNMKSLTV